MVSKEYFDDDSILFKTIKLPGGRIAKIMNRKVHEGALKAAAKVMRKDK